MTQLKIDAPCPVLISRMTKAGNDFSCKSCSKKVVDFRDKSPEEINLTLTKGMCGIFLTTQLPAQVKMTRFRQFLFYGLTLLSFLGFNVNPINAQSSRTIKNTSLKQTSASFIEPQEINNDDEKKDKRKSRRKERKERRELNKNKRKVVVGVEAYD